MRVLLTGGLLLGVWMTVPFAVMAQESPATDEVSNTELRDLVDTLEDEKRREVLVKDLKKLIEFREAAVKQLEPSELPEKKRRRLLAVEGLFEAFESLTRRLIDAASSTVNLVRKAPDALKDVRAFVSQSENQSRLLRLLGSTGASVLFALIIALLLKRYTPKVPEYEPSLTYKMGTGLLWVLLRVIPYAAVIGALFVLFQVFPSFRVGQAVILLFFFVLFFYQFIFVIFRVLLSPEASKLRILPVGDEDANYLWVWVIRFINYTGFYFLITRALLLVDVATPTFGFIRGLLLVVFPLMISVFVLQVAREIRIRYQGSMNPDTDPEPRRKRGLTLTVRYWPALALSYTWAVFIFMIVRYEQGFGYLIKATLGTAIAVIALFVALRLMDWIFGRIFTMSERVRERFPGLEAKTNRYIRIVRKGLGVLVIIIGVGIVARVWGVPVDRFVASPAGSMLIFKVIAILITVGLVVVVIETSQFISSYLLQEKKRNRKRMEPTQKMKTLIPMINTAIRIAAAFVGGIVILDQMGVNTTPILAGAGIVGLAVGFGSQTLVKDLINGLFILFEESIRVGDVVVIGGKGGIVEAVGLRTIKMRDLAGNVHVIPNSSIETLMNMTKGYSRYVFDVGVAYREDADEVMGILREIGEEMQNDPAYGKDILEPLEILGVDRFEDSAVVIRARITTKPIRQWAVGREFNRRMKRVFDERGIEIPFPHRTIYMGEPKEGLAPALQVRMKEEGP
jgi:small conductance mechanosensitive channel